MEQQLKENVENLFREYTELDEIVKKNNERVKNKTADLKDSLKDKTMEEIEELLTYMYVDNMLQNKTLQIVFARLISNIDLLKAVDSEPFSDDLEKFYKEMRIWMPSRIFHAKNGELIEAEEGILEKARKEFLEGDYLKSIKEQFAKQ